jgi:3-oxoacyl-[acyl-carrier-protein] synthase II
VAATVVDFKPADFMPPMVYRRMSPVSRLAVAASIEAAADSGIDFKTLESERVAILMGTAYGSSSHVDQFYLSLLNDGPRRAQPLLFPETVPNAPASHIAMFHQVQGPNATFCQNDISAEAAMIYAKSLLELDVVDVVLVGGAEELSEILFACHDAVGGLNPIRATDYEEVYPQPGGGIILGEGAAVLVMEKRRSAIKRGTKIYGNLVSDASTGDFSAMGHYAKTGDSVLRTCQQAMEQAGIKPTDIDHINISANYAKELDALEYRQLKKLFTDKQESLQVTPLKYLIGDFGAAGAIRAAAVLLSLHHQLSLPEVKLSMLSSDQPGAINWTASPNKKITKALMTSTTFGGGSASMIFTRSQ